MSTHTSGGERKITHRRLAANKSDMSNPGTPPSPSINGKVGDAGETGSDLPLSPTRQDSSSNILPPKDEDDDMERGKGGCCYPETRWWAVVLRLGVCVLAGLIFGWCLEKGRGK